MHALSIRLSGAIFLLLQVGLLAGTSTLLNTGSVEGFLLSLIFLIVAGLAVLAALGFVFLHYAGWLVAMMVQGLSLLVALLIYFQSAPLWWVYGTMTYGVFMVLYLNSYVIRSAFRNGAVLERDQE